MEFIFSLLVSLLVSLIEQSSSTVDIVVHGWKIPVHSHFKKVTSVLELAQRRRLERSFTVVGYCVCGVR
jgi:hypothetical protein